MYRRYMIGCAALNVCMALVLGYLEWHAMLPRLDPKPPVGALSVIFFAAIFGAAAFASRHPHQHAHDRHGAMFAATMVTGIVMISVSRVLGVF